MANSKVRRRQARPQSSFGGTTEVAEGRILHPTVLGVLLLALTFLAYAPAWNGQPIWDDDAHMVRPALQSLGGLVRIWTEPGATQQYYPLVHSVFWLEQRIWGNGPLPYHLLNILFHGVSALLLLRILQNLRIRGAWLAAAIFALHPVQVESVAWISELKNTLSGVFFFTALLWYLKFDEFRRRGLYALALGAFALGLLCKTVIATFPAVVLVLFWWKRGRLSWKRDVRPLIPFFVVGIGAGLFTAWVERNFVGARGEAFDYGLIDRGLIAGRAFWFYLSKLFWPANLIFIYPHWRIDASVWWQYLFPGAALLLFGGLFAFRTRGRAPLAAVLAFAGILFPVLGFLNVFPFIYSFVADHFQYLACVPVIILTSSGLALAAQRFNLLRWQRYLFCAALVGALATLTWRQCRIYHDVETLYRSTIQRNPQCWMAHYNLAIALGGTGQTEEAIVQYQQTLALRPDDADAHYNLGRLLVEKGDFHDAISHYQQALTFEPSRPEIKNNLGSALFQSGRVVEAVALYKEALALRPGYSDASANLANALLAQGDVDGAIVRYAEGLAGSPNRPMEQYRFANLLLQQGRTDEAIVHYQKALELSPENAAAHTNLGDAFLEKGRAGDAIAQYRAALAIAPQAVSAQSNLAWLLATAADPSLRNGPEAVSLAEEANKISGGRPLILRILAASYAETGRFADATRTAQEALALAQAQDNRALLDAILKEITLYQSGLPYHKERK